MKTFEMNCYEVIESYDRDSSHIAFVSCEYLAAELVAKQKGYRSYAPYKKTITVFDTMEEIEENSVRNIRKAALAKLTPKEIEILGLVL